MCIIVTFRPGSLPVPRTVLADMWDQNPHGGGVAWHTGRKLNILRGVMSKREWIDATRNAMDHGYAVVSHARISSVGGVRPALTHPWPVYADGDRDRLIGALAHNGHVSSWRREALADPLIDYADPILPFDYLRTPDDVDDKIADVDDDPLAPYRSAMSDIARDRDLYLGSSFEVQATLAARPGPALPSGPWSDTRYLAHAAGYYGPDRVLADPTVLAGQKFALLTTEGQITRYGHWTAVSDGVHVSNTHYQWNEIRIEWSKGKAGTQTGKLVTGPPAGIRSKSKSARRRARRQSARK